MKKIDLDINGWYNPVGVLQNKTIRRSAEKFLVQNKDNHDVRSGRWINKRGNIVDDPVDEPYLFVKDLGDYILVQKSVFLYSNPSYEDRLRLR